MSQCTGVDKIWSALYSSGALAEREVENKIGHAFSTFAVVVLALGHFAKLADCGFATIYLIIGVFFRSLVPFERNFTIEERGTKLLKKTIGP